MKAFSTEILHPFIGRHSVSRCLVSFVVRSLPVLCLLDHEGGAGGGAPDPVPLAGLLLGAAGGRNSCRYVYMDVSA